MSDVPLIVDPAVVVVDRRRHGEWRRKAAAAAICAALLLIVGMASMSHSRSRADIDGDLLAAAKMEFGAAPSAAPRPPSRHIQIIAKEKKFLKDTNAVRSHLTVYASRGDQSLAEFMADKSPHDFPMLHEEHVKRARACPDQMLCSFKGKAKMSMHTEVEQFDPVKERKHSDTSSNTEMDVWFDIFETDSLGCVRGHVTYQLNITDIRTSKLTMDEHSDDAPDEHKEFDGDTDAEGNKDETTMLMAYQAKKFVFVQDTATGQYVNFIHPDDEMTDVVNTKRSLINDLNPIINVADESMTVKRPDGSMLFQMAFRGINGFQRTVYSLKHHPTEAGTHEIQHFTRLTQEDQRRANEEYHPEEDVDGYGQSGDQSTDDDKSKEVPEPDTCPYKAPTKETQIGKSSGTSKVKGDSVEDVDYDGDMAVGQDADEETNPIANENSAKDEVDENQRPVKGKSDLVATYKAERLGTRSFASPCLRAGLSVDTNVQPAVSALQPSSPPSGQAARFMTLAEFREAVPTPAKAKDAKDVAIYDSHSKGGRDDHMVRRSFSSPIIQEELNEDYHDDGSVSHKVKELVNDITSNPGRNLKPGQGGELRKACDHGAVRRGVMSYLRDDTADSKKQRRMAVAFLGACEASIRKKGTQQDVISLAADKTAKPKIRDQAIMALAGLKCPTMFALTSLHELTKSGDQELSSSTLLTLGAMLRNSRKCEKSGVHASSKVQAMERGMNVMLQEAVKAGETRQIETILYAMHNSGAGHHMGAIKQALAAGSTIVRSVGVKEAALTAVQGIGYVATGNTAGGAEHQELMDALNEPLEPAEVWPNQELSDDDDNVDGDDDDAYPELPSSAPGDARSQQLVAVSGDVDNLSPQVVINGTIYFNDKFEMLQEKPKDKNDKGGEVSGDKMKGKVCKTLGLANIFCYSKRIPERSVVNSLNSVKIGLGKGLMHQEKENSCTTFIDAVGKTELELNTGLPIDELNPLVIPLTELQGQLFLGGKDKNGRRFAGSFKFLGFVLKNFGAEIIEPCGLTDEEEEEQFEEEKKEIQKKDKMGVNGDLTGTYEDGVAEDSEHDSVWQPEKGDEDRYTEAKGPGYDIDGGGWTLVRRVPASYGAWHPAMDNLYGNDMYGFHHYDANSECEDCGGPWSIHFENAVPGYDEILFANGDASQWMIMSRAQVEPRALGWKRIAEKSSLNPKMHLTSYIWQRPEQEPGHGGVYKEDPWIEDTMQNPRCFLYHGGESKTHLYDCIKKHKGANVFIRRTPGFGYQIDGGGWTLVRRNPPNRGKWHPAKDDCSGTESYGKEYVTRDSLASTQPWSLNFEETVPEYDEVLFSTGDGNRWLIMKKTEVARHVRNQHVWVEKSAWTPSRHTVRSYNRPEVPSDPWIGDKDHHWLVNQMRAHGGKQGYIFLYHEDNYEGHSFLLQGVDASRGSNVFIRNSKAPKAESPKQKPAKKWFLKPKPPTKDRKHGVRQSDFRGYCGFDKTEYSGIEDGKDKQVPIVPVNGRFFMIGPVKLSLYAYFNNEMSYGLTVASEDRSWKLRNEGYDDYGYEILECSKGGYSGSLGVEAFSRFDIGGGAEVGLFKATLGLEITLLNVELRGTGDVLAKGFSKEVLFEVKALEGQVLAKLYIRWFHCWWGRCLVDSWWGCIIRLLQCAGYWKPIYGHKIWGWNGVLKFGNLFCGPIGDFGCPTYEPSAIASMLHNMLQYVCLDGLGEVCYSPQERLRRKELEGKKMDVAPTQSLDAGNGFKKFLIAPPATQSLADGQDNVADLENKCDYLVASGYRGLVNVAANGQQCLSWPNEWTQRYYGTGLAKDPSKCEDNALIKGSLCWSTCIRQLETNNYCRSPDDAAVPYCRTGGSEEVPVFSDCSQLVKCKEENQGYTHHKVDASDYSGQMHWTTSGKVCDLWAEDKEYRKEAEHWGNRCKNPDGKRKYAWCLVTANKERGWEYCNVGVSAEDPEGSQKLIDEVEAEGKEIKAKEDEEKAKVADDDLPSKPYPQDDDGEVVPVPDGGGNGGGAAAAPGDDSPDESQASSDFPREGIFVHYSAAGWGKTSKNVWDDESGNGRHSISVTGNVRQGFAKGNGAQHRIPFVSGDASTSVTFPMDTVPSEFTICSLSRYSSDSSRDRIIGAAGRDDWFHGHYAASAGVAKYGKWMTRARQAHILVDDWLIMCGQNGASPMVLADGKEVDVASGGDGGVQLAINDQSAAETSAWQVSAITVWSRQLSEAEMWNAFKGYSKYLSEGPKYGVMGMAAAVAFPKQGLFSHFAPDGFGKTRAGQWDDASGNGRHSVSHTGSIRKDFGVGGGSGHEANIFYVKGSSESSIIFGDASIPEKFTICSLTRYVGATRGQILAAADKDWFHGHSNGRSGVAFYGSWMTDPEKTQVEPSLWLVMCGQNAYEPIILANGMEVEKGSGGEGLAKLSINDGKAGDSSDWAVHGFTVWDRHLTRDEITAASMTYLRYLDQGGNGIDV